MPPGNNSIDLILRLLYDKSSGAQAASDIEGTLNKLGVKFNEATQRFQDVTSGKFVGASKVSQNVADAFNTGKLFPAGFDRTAAVANKIAATLGDTQEGLALTNRSIDMMAQKLGVSTEELQQQLALYNQISEIAAQVAAESATARPARPTDVQAALQQLTAVQTAGFGTAGGGVTDVGNAQRLEVVLQAIAQDLGVTTEELKANIAGFNALGGAEKKMAFEAAGLKVPADVLRQVRDEAKVATEAQREEVTVTRASQAQIAAAKRAQAKEAEALVNEQEKQAARLAKQQQNLLLQGVGGFALIRLGSGLERAGRQILAPMMEWQKAVGQNTAYTTEWAESMRSIQGSTIRIGGAMENTMLPSLREMAKIANQAAKFLEDNPWAASLLAKVGIAGIAGGAALRGIGEIVTLLSILKVSGLLGAIGGGAVAAGGKVALGTAATAAVGGAEGAAGLGVGAAEGAAVGGLSITPAGIAIAFLAAAPAIGLVIGNVVNKAIGQKPAGVRDVAISGIEFILLAELEFTRTVKAIGELLGTLGKPLVFLSKRFTEFVVVSDKLYKTILGLPGGLFGGGGAVPPTQVKGSANEIEIVQDFMAYKKQEKLAEQQTEEQRLGIIQKFGEAMVAAEQTRDKRIDEIHKSFAEQQTQQLMTEEKQDNQAEQTYYRERANIIRDGDIEIQRIEEDLQETLLKLKREHNDKMADLEGERDAFGIVKEQRDYRRQREDDIRGANIEIGRRRQDLAIRLSDLAANFKAEQQQREQQHAEQLAIQATQEAEQVKQAQDTYNEQKLQAIKQRNDALKALADGAKKEAELRRQALIDQINLLNDAITGETAIRRQGYANALADAENFFAQLRQVASGNQVGAGMSKPSSASGGYVYAGLWNLHNGEYVMNSSVTALAERAAGGQLSSSSLANALVGGRGNITVNNHITFSGEVTAMSKRIVYDVAYKATEDAIVEHLGRNS